MKVSAWILSLVALAAELCANPLEGLEAGQARILPPFRVEAGDLTLYDVHRKGPGQRDYCNKMVYAPERKTALYAGGNHMSPHRMNDVWEYDLAANTWRLLYAPDGGNAGKHKAAYFLSSRTLVREPDRVLNEKEQGQLAAYKDWWMEHVHLADGHLCTKNGGPIMPAHTWDALSYDPRAKRMLWGMGANPAAQPSTHARFTGQSLAQVEKQLDPDYTPMWQFEPAAKRWIHHRSAQTHPPLRGMGATLCWIPDLGRTLWYTAAQNVSPHAFEMWLYDGVADRWEELKPNGGARISDLVKKQGVAPGAELQTAYSAKHRKLVAVIKQDAFVYDFAKHAWSKLCSDPRIYAHDAKSIFAYDEHADAFLLLFPPEGKGKQLELAVLDLGTGRWELPEILGPKAMPAKYGMNMGYYDPDRRVLVAQARYTDRMWVYRHR